MLDRCHSSRSCGITAEAENHVVIERTIDVGEQHERATCPGVRQICSICSVHTSAVPSRTTTPSWFTIVVRSVVSGLSSRTSSNLDLGRDLVARPHRRPEAPVDVQEDAARAREILGDHGVEQPGRHAALHDEPPNR